MTGPVDPKSSDLPVLRGQWISIESLFLFVNFGLTPGLTGTSRGHSDLPTCVDSEGSETVLLTAGNLFLSTHVWAS